jgi:hypothetical protein
MSYQVIGRPGTPAVLGLGRPSKCAAQPHGRVRGIDRLLLGGRSTCAALVARVHRQNDCACCRVRQLDMYVVYISRPLLTRAYRSAPRADVNSCSARGRSAPPASSACLARFRP